MSSVFPQGIKDLKISAPTNVGQPASTLRCKVILVAKFDFNAESKGEISVKKGDVLKLLDRLANGWVLVEFIDKIAVPGLVPSLYVDIAVNDPVNPITLSWLHEVSSNGSQAYKTFNDIQVQMLLEKNSPFSINNKLYPLSVSVTNYLMFENRFWYRVDVTYSSGEQGYLCRYYSDFYDLHLSLLDYLNSTDKSADNETLRLPKLPEPVPSQRRNSAEQSDLFSRRCRELSAYMHELISTKKFQVCTALVDWLAVTFKELPGFVVDDAPLSGSDVINQRILPGSVILGSKTSPPVSADSSRDADTSTESAKFITPSKDAPRVNKPKNVYNHYQQAANAKINIARSLSTSEGRYPTRSSSKLERARTVNHGTMASNGTGRNDLSDPAKSPTLYKSRSMRVAPSAKMASPLMTPKQKFTPEMSQMHTPPRKIMSPNTSSGSNSSEGESDKSLGLSTPASSQGTPQSQAAPIFPPRKVSFGLPTAKSPKEAQGKRVKCEIKTQTNDNVVVRVNVAETPHIDAFKAAIYSKYAYNNLFIRVEEGGSYEEIDSPEFDMMAMIRSSDTVSMLVT
ncbi:hypothetical protein OXX79_002171 [Metschnikowia pulcherrima]